ncbi:hypothetical protein FRC20_006014 [Serendipita sp. 405]|nr:hypothetical protein FRC20_006014 [Serendipita sp. 405]
MLPHFCLEKGYVNLNHGSYGSCPRPVFDSAQEMALKIESKPDYFFRIELFGYMKAVRESLATFINASHIDEVVMVPNATHGINVILHNLQLKEGDILIGFNTTYVAISSTLRRYADATPTPQLQIITLAFPTTPEAIISTFRKHIEQNVKRTAGTRVVALIDAIISNPGVLLPWEELVQICKENRIVSVVDAAHAIGQIPLDMQRTDPDYLVSNCHKWLYTKRSSSILYTPKRNHQSMRWTFPISEGYTSPPNEVKFAEQYEWLGTIDYAPYLSVIPALQFRKELGGEDRIRSYCHGLAREGGSKMAEILGTELMDKDDKFTANMVDVLLPLSEEEIKILPSNVPGIIHTRLLENWHCMSAVYKHNGKIWTRASAQIWIEVSDFEYVARALATICKDLVQEATGSQ